MNIGKDKMLHCICCMAVVVVLTLVGTPLWLSAFIAVIIGITKEIYDMQYPEEHTAEWGDIAADSVGIIIGILICIMYEAIF